MTRTMNAETNAERWDFMRSRRLGKGRRREKTTAENDGRKRGREPTDEALGGQAGGPAADAGSPLQPPYTDREVPVSPSSDPSRHEARRRLVCGSSAAGRLTIAADWLRSHAADTVLLLSPSRGAADDLLRRVVSGGERGEGAESGVFAVHRLTLRQLAGELATRSLARGGLQPVHGLALEALAARAVDICLDREQLVYFEPVAELPGMARATLRTLLDLRGAGLDPGDLAGSERAPLRDLAYLLAAFEESLREARVADPPAVLRRAARVCGATGDGGAEATPLHDLLGRPILLLDHTPSASAETELLAALFARSPDVLATLAQGDEEGLEALRPLLGAERRLDEDASLDGGPEDNHLAKLRRRIFRDLAFEQVPEAGDTSDDLGDEESDDEQDDDSFSFFAAAGEGRESVEIARKILDLARTGLLFDRVAIALRDPVTYLPLIEEALTRARVPAYFSRGTVRPDPAGRAFLALLACTDEHLSASRFAEFLSLDQAPDPDDDGAPPEVDVPWVEPEGEQLVFKGFFELPPEPQEAGDAFDPGRRLQTPRHWERLLVDAAVIEGKERWRRRLEGVAAELRLQIRHADDGDESERRHQEGLAAELRRLEELRRFALPLIDELDALPKKAVWGTWRKALEALAVRALREPERVLRVLTELRPMDNVGPVALDEVRRVLETRLVELRAEPDGRRHGKVWVGTVDELRGRRFHTVFLPGLAEGRFPRRPTEDPLLLDVHRRALTEALATTELATRDLQVERERLLLRLAVGAADQRLVTSYPSLDSLQGRPKVPSFYALDLLRAAEGRLPDLRNLERRAVAESSSRLGWPAPRDASAAVDDAEFDLATLLDLLARPVDEVKGQGRYLLEANEPLRRALRHRYCRWNLRKLTPADGLVAHGDSEDAQAIRDALKGHRLHQRAYSPTALQNYAMCPLRFFYQAILRLRPRDRPERLEQLDPLTRGSLFHEAQFELLSGLRDDGLLGLLVEAGDDDRSRLLTAADQALDRVADRYREELAPAVPRVWQAEIEGLRIDLRGWLRAVLAAQDGFRPERFELAFGLRERLEDGLATHDPASSPEEAVLEDGWRLRGSIDLVERHAETGELRATDHKTGKRPDTARAGGLRVGRGELLQPLLYALVAARRLDAPVRGGRLFYCTRRGDFQAVDVPVDERGTDSLDVVLDTIDGAVAHGVLPAAPKDGACRWCDYRQICGPSEERRTARKQDDLLGPLRRVRAIP